MKQIGLVWRTVRHLTARQLVYQVLTRLLGRVRLRLSTASRMGYFLSVPAADKPVSWVAGTFTFLNRSVHMLLIDGNYAGNGKLWTYNLNYFDFLNQPDLIPDDGLRLMRDFMAQTERLRDGLESYPTSLRITNWVHFLSRNHIQDGAINRHLYAQTCLLRRRLEHHIGGNHLLENGLALLTAALYFQHDGWYRQAAKLVRSELSAQILDDGGHDERSPMYHQLLLDRLLDMLLVMKHNGWHNDPAFTDFLKEKATQMLGWLDTITFQNGDVPMLNDAAWGSAPTTNQLRAKAVQIGLSSNPWPLKAQTTGMATGYRTFTFPRYELVADVGPVGPDHQPGHAHADTFSFVLYVDNQPLIVDSGTSTYELGSRRTWERSTAAHNTVEINGMNSSEVWGAFRVGRRARVTVLTSTETTLMARHDGYRAAGIIHERTWLVEPMHIRITDRLLKTNGRITHNQSSVARLHFHPDVLISLVDGSIDADPVRITFASEYAPELHLTTYEMANGFNRLRPAPCVAITFINRLETYIALHRDFRPA